MAFCKDRYASIGTGWPMTIDEKDILTNLPASDEAFEMSRPEQTPPLAEAMSPAGASKLSSFGGVVLMACLFGRNLVHLHRPDVDDRDHDLNGEFWKRHRNLDNILLNTSLCLPSHLKLPAGITNANIVFTNMCIHTSTICLHQAAIFKADKNRLPASVSSESKVRCITAANEIASIMRMISHLDLAAVGVQSELLLLEAQLTGLDESIYLLLPLRFSSGFCSIPQEQARRQSNSGFPALPALSHECAQEAQSSHRILPCPT